MADRGQSDLQGYGNSVGSNTVPRATLPPGMQIPTRQLSGISTADIEREPMKYVALALVHLRNQNANLAQQIADHSRPFDEYLPRTLTGDSETSINLQPTFESTERVESIIITGPPGNVSLQLGDRLWALTIPATGILVIAPVHITLERSDNRQLTAATPGQYSLELMGYVDERA